MPSASYTRFTYLHGCCSLTLITVEVDRRKLFALKAEKTTRSNTNTCKRMLCTFHESPSRGTCRIFCKCSFLSVIKVS